MRHAPAYLRFAHVRAYKRAVLRSHTCLLPLHCALVRRASLPARTVATTLTILSILTHSARAYAGAYGTGDANQPRCYAKHRDAARPSVPYSMEG